MKLRRPHCKAWAHVRSSTQITPLLQAGLLAWLDAKPLTRSAAGADHSEVDD